MHAERRIFRRQLVERDAHFFLIAFGLRLNRNCNDWRGELDRFQNDGVLIGANRVTGGDVLQANAGTNITRINLADLFALVGMHLQETPNALMFAGARVQHAIA